MGASSLPSVARVRIKDAPGVRGGAFVGGGAGRGTGGN